MKNILFYCENVHPRIQMKCYAWIKPLKKNVVRGVEISKQIEITEPSESNGES